MNTNPNQPDAAIDKALAALNAAPPPEGLEARIAARIAAQPAPASGFHWRNLRTGSTLASAWWHGAAAGAAFALFAVAAVLLLQHASRPTPPHVPMTVANPAPGPSVISVKAAVNPCTPPSVLRVDTAIPSPSLERPENFRAEARAESAAPSHPAPVLPLTPQELALAQLARTADPKQLAILTPEIEARLEAENAAEFTKFFTPPPTPPQPVLETPPVADQSANPENSPAANPPVASPTTDSAPGPDRPGSEPASQPGNQCLSEPIKSQSTKEDSR